MHKAFARPVALLTGMGLLMSASALSTRAHAQVTGEPTPPPLTGGQSPSEPSPAPDAGSTSPDANPPAPSPDAPPGPAAVSPAVTTTPATGVQSGVVCAIKVEGNERIEADTVISYLPIAVGDTVDPARFDLAIKTLFRTDLFADVSAVHSNMLDPR